MKRGDERCGFTLVELLIGSTLAAVIMMAVLSSFVFLGRNLTRISNYQTLEAKAREANTYLSRDLSLAESVKTGTTPTASTLTLVLPSGEVTYSYDAGSSRLRRQATFGASRDIYLLTSDSCSCTSFAFDYHAASGGAATSQITTGVFIPYSIKQIEATFTVASPTGFSPETRSTYDAVTPRFVLRNRQLPDGT